MTSLLGIKLQVHRRPRAWLGDPVFMKKDSQSYALRMTDLFGVKLQALAMPQNKLQITI